MLKEISTIIQNAAIGFTQGTNMFTGFETEAAPDEATLLREFGGVPNEYLADRIDPFRLQIICRSFDYWVARANAYKIYNYLNLRSNVTIVSVDTPAVTYLINHIEAVDAPQPIGMDVKGRFEFSTNFHFRVGKS